MNTITEKLSQIFSEKQIQLLKDSWKCGSWGDCEINFGGEENEWGLGACTNDAKNAGNFKGREISGIMSGIAKKIKQTGTNLIASFPDWWGDGTGDMVFFNTYALGYEDSTEGWKALDNWSRSID